MLDEILDEFRYGRGSGLVVAEAVSAFEGWRDRVDQRSRCGLVLDEYERGSGLLVAEAVSAFVGTLIVGRRNS